MKGGERSFIRAIRGPVTLITVGVLFALNNFTPYRFEQTWPVILIVFGLLSLLRRGLEPLGPAPEIPGMPPGAPPYAAYPQPGTYRQSSYPQTAPTGPPPAAKGGFGSSAPHAAGDAGQTPPAGGTL